MNPTVSSDQFPAGLRVLAVDDDPTCLVILEKMLRNCLYQVTKCSRAEVALKTLRENRGGFDVVISDVHMPDMDGFTLLECIGLEMDLPVIMMSADDSSSVVLKGVTHGACDYLIKPVRMEALKNIWQHVIRKTRHEWREKDVHEQRSGSVEEGADRNPNTSDDYSSANEGNNCKSSSKKRKDRDDEERDDTSASKKPRVVWTVELHQQFVSAVNQLGIDKAFPKRILEIMNVPGLSRENVASHLQKYRMFLKKLSVGHHQNVYGIPFMAPTDPTFVPPTPPNGHDFHNIASSSQLLPQGALTTIQTSRSVTNRAPISGSLVDQSNFFSFENQRRQLNNNKQVNLRHGIPTNVNLPMHSRASQLVQPQPWNQLLSCPVNRQPMIPNMGMGRNRVDALRAQPFASSSHPSSFVDISRSGPSGNDAFPLINNSGMTGTTTSNHAVFNNPSQNKNGDWALHSGGPTFDATRHGTNMQARVDVAPSVLVQPGFSSDQRSVHITTPSSVNSTNLGQQLPSSTSDNSLSRINPDGLADIRSQNSNPLSDQFGHDDLSAFFKEPEEGVLQGESLFELDCYHLDNLPV